MLAFKIIVLIEKVTKSCFICDQVFLLHYEGLVSVGNNVEFVLISFILRNRFFSLKFFLA